MTPTVDIFICKAEDREILKAGHFHNLGGIARDGYSLKNSMQHYNLSLISNHYQITSYEHVNTHQTQLKQATICPWDLHSNPLVLRKSDAVCKSSRLYFSRVEEEGLSWWLMICVGNLSSSSYLQLKNKQTNKNQVVSFGFNCLSRQTQIFVFVPSLETQLFARLSVNKTTINSGCSREWAHPGQSKIALEPKAKKSCLPMLWALSIVIALAGE